MATLTTNNEVQLFEPRKNAHKGEWIEVRSWLLGHRMLGPLAHAFLRRADVRHQFQARGSDPSRQKWDKLLLLRHST